MYSDDSDDERRESVLSTGHRGSVAMGNNHNNRQSKRQSHMHANVNRESYDNDKDEVHELVKRM